jgi:hypothetical protein
VTGKFASEIFDMLEQLMNDGDLLLHFACTPDGGHQNSTNRSQYAAMSVACTLSLIVYGPPERCDEVGAFFQDSELYLQDPKGCNLNTKYCNPHRLSSLKLEECPMTFSLELPSIHLDEAIFQKISSDSDILDIFNAQQNLPESPQPDAIQSQLKRQDPHIKYQTSSGLTLAMSQGIKSRRSRFFPRGSLVGTLIHPLQTFGIKCK